MTAIAPEQPLCLFEKIWNDHIVADLVDGQQLIHIDRHVIHEASSPQAFNRLRAKGRKVNRPDLTFATIDHIVSTAPGRTGATFSGGVELVEALRENCAEFGIRLFDLDDEGQGIVHIISVEQAIALPGCTLVCGDSHTSTMGGIGALAWGAGASEVEHVLTTQSMVRKRPKTMRVLFEGTPGKGVSAKDLILRLIGQNGADGGVGHVVEYAGPAIEEMEIESRLTVCNMSVEFGARAGLIAPDAKTVDYLHGRKFAPRDEQWDAAVECWSQLSSDDEATFDCEITVDCNQLAPQVTWGNSGQQVISVAGVIPQPDDMTDTNERAYAIRSLDYMDLVPGTPIEGLKIDVAFIGSCTNGRLSDLEEAARIIDGRKVAEGIRALAVPGSAAIKKAAEEKGLDRIFRAAGFEWREAGCSMCLSLNDDRVPEGQRCISASNRSFEGRQGKGSRTHLASPATVAASALAGAIADPRKFSR